MFQFPELVIVEASAGSGKTYALAKRYIQLLLLTKHQRPLALKHILAITFTKKAASGMRERIIYLLKQMALGLMPLPQEDEIVKPLGIESQDVRRLAFELMQEVLTYYHYFHVGTIDSFMNMILSASALKLNLSAQFKVETSIDQTLERCVDEFIWLAQFDKEKYDLLINFCDSYLILENRGGWLPLRDLRTFLKTIIAQEHALQRAPVASDKSLADILALKYEILGLIDELFNQLPQGVDKRFLKALEAIKAKSVKGIDFAHLSTYFLYDQIPCRKGEYVESSLQDIWIKIRQRLSLLAKWESESLFNGYVHIYHHLKAMIDDLSQREDVIFLSGLNIKTAMLIDQGLLNADELFLRLAARFDHYLIDEFQDTSLLQWRNISLMVQESLSRQGSLFYVGDKKQAIYSFRGGDSRLFDALPLQFPINAKRLYLSNNYRSLPAIVDFNNALYHHEHLMGVIEKLQLVVFSDDDKAMIQAAYGHAHQEAVNKAWDGAVTIRHLPKANKTALMGAIREQLITDIRQLLHEYQYLDIAVLVRDNNDTQEMAQWLIEQGFPVNAHRTLDILAHQGVIELNTILMFLNDPINDQAFAEILLGEVFTHASHTSPEQWQQWLLDQHVKEHDRQEYVHQRFLHDFPSLWQEFFEPYLKKAGIVNVYELAVDIINIWRINDYFQDEALVLAHWLDLMLLAQQKGCSITVFLMMLEQLPPEHRYIPIGQFNAIRVLTIHQSKGLEYPVVILPMLTMEIKSHAGGFPKEPTHNIDIEPQGFHLLRLNKHYAQYNHELEVKYMAARKQAIINEINTMYVATTRAIERLMIYVPAGVGHTPNPVVQFSDNISVRESIKPKQDQQDLKFNHDNIPIDWRLYQAPMKVRW